VSGTHLAAEGLRAVLDAIPSIVVAVDENVRVVEYNAAAAHLVGGVADTILRRRSGEVLHCINARDSPLGCGAGPRCSDCVIRNSVTAAFRGGAVVRHRSRLDLELSAGGVTTIHALVTATPFRSGEQELVLLVIEDVSELVRLKEVVPICARCKKVRTDDEYWIHVESFIQQYADVDFSHGYCPVCAQEEKKRIRRFQAERASRREGGAGDTGTV
jgi:hypothetical protein